jgi:hypothetical protein
MYSMSKPTRLLGVAFLFQAVMPMIGQSIQRRLLIVPGEITKSMHNIANHPKIDITGYITASGQMKKLGSKPPTLLMDG